MISLCLPLSHSPFDLALEDYALAENDRDRFYRKIYFYFFLERKKTNMNRLVLQAWNRILFAMLVLSILIG